MPDQHAAFFKCFSTWSRNRLLQLLAEHGELSVEELSHQLGLKEPTVSRHLQLLRLHGIVEVRTVPPVHYYSVNRELISRQFGKFLSFLGVEPIHGPPPTAGSTR